MQKSKMLVGFLMICVAIAIVIYKLVMIDPVNNLSADIVLDFDVSDEKDLMLEKMKHFDIKDGENKLENKKLSQDYIETTNRFEVLRRDNLDRQIDNSYEDFAWQEDVHKSVSDVLSLWPGAQVFSTRCSSQLCRVEFVVGDKKNVAGIIDQLNNISVVQGERMIQIDDVENGSAIAYFGRNASIFFDLEN